MSYGKLAATFQNIEETVDVAPQVSTRILERVPHAGLSGEVNNTIELTALKQFADLFGVLQIAFDEPESGLIA
jgi:hypothetical protein